MGPKPDLTALLIRPADREPEMNDMLATEREIRKTSQDKATTESERMTRTPDSNLDRRLDSIRQEQLDGRLPPVRGRRRSGKETLEVVDDLRQKVLDLQPTHSTPTICQSPRAE